MSLILDGSNGITFPNSSTQAVGFYGFKNRIINGGMVIDQRNAGASVATNGTNLVSLDRWKMGYSQNTKFTVQQNAGSITPPAGFVNYLGVTSTSAYTVGSGEAFSIYEVIEGNNIADLGWGTANASSVTLSFRVYSSLTGTFGGCLQNYSQARSYPFSYSVPVANTWTTISITIAGDTSGTWLTNNSGGIILQFGIGVGSTFSGTAGSWASANYVSATGATSVVGTNGATFYITGVQLEAGSTATSFDYRPYGTELALCQRYWQQSYTAGTVAGTATQVGAADILPGTSGIGTMGGFSYFRTEMRAIPTVTLYDLAGASGKVFKGGNGKTGVLQNQATTGFTGYTTDATAASEMLYQWVASSEL